MRSVFALGNHLNAFRVAKHNRVCNAFCLSLDSSLEHVEVAFGKHDALRVAAGGIAELTDELVVITHHVAEAIVVSVPIGNRLAGHATLT